MALNDTPFRRLKYGLLGKIPGDKGRYYRRKHLRLLAPEAREQFNAAIAKADGGLCIDLGANVGTYTRAMALHAGKVVAFEPDPWTVQRLRDNCSDLENVEIMEAAAGTEDGTIELFRTPDFDADPEQQSLSSSVISSKLNVDSENGITVPAINCIRFLRELDGKVAVLKIDIEGAEVPLLETLFDDPVLQKIDNIFVETHESRVPDLSARSEALRRRARKIPHPAINMNWI